MKKNPLISIPFLVLSIFLLSACQFLPWVRVVRGSGNLTAETRPVSGFNAIRLDGAGRLVITQGPAESLEIQAEDNLINELTSQVEDGTLVLGYRDRPWRKSILPTRPIVYTLVVTDLAKLTLNGAGDINLQSLQTDALVLEINGAGNFEINALSADSLFVKIMGTGSISVSGAVAKQEVSLDGAASYQAGNLQTRSTAIEINGLGSGTVWASETLDISINGGGSVSYYGSPTVTQEITGLGDVRNLGEK
ncbi:MAG: DUF2807 domain-containing protein [Brevefilum sp.]|nr:DUF2807 domain-containing protein [Brevefilum sp.]